MKKKLTFIISVCLILIWSISTFASAQELNEIKRERDELNAKVSNTKNELSTIQAQIYQTQLKILDFDERLTVASGDLDVINGDISITDARFNEIQGEIVTAQDDYDSKFTAYKKRVRVMYEYGSASYLDILMQTTSVSEFLTQLEYLNAIAKHDKEMVEKLKSSEKELLVMREEYDRQLNTLEELRYRQETLTKEIAATLAEQNTLMVALLENEENAEFRLENESEEAAAMEEAYKVKRAEYEAQVAAEAAKRAAERQKSIANYNGKMNWPAPQFSRVTDQYGPRTHPITGKQEFHKGLDIAAPMNSDIIAAEGGVVITATYNWSYGNYIVVDHGGGVSTLYAHSAKLLVSEGQTVSKGQVIAKVGSTGVSTGAHLHFEVHINGEHTSPRAYVNY